MNPSRKLFLRREALTDLNGDQMRAVAAGATTVPCMIDFGPPPTEGISCVRCPSLPLTNCTILTETDTLTCPTDIC